VDSLKALDPNRPIREADMLNRAGGKRKKVKTRDRFIQLALSRLGRHRQKAATVTRSSASALHAAIKVKRLHAIRRRLLSPCHFDTGESRSVSGWLTLNYFDGGTFSLWLFVSPL
jgi:hypothetical protein